MDAVEFLKEWDRMCKSNEKCKECDGYKLCTSEEGICSNCEELVKAVENWSKTNPVIILTEQQKTAIRGRIAEGYRWIVGWHFSDVVFSVEKPEQNENGGIGLRGRISYGDFLFFNFAKGNSIFYLPDLLGGEE